MKCPNITGGFYTPQASNSEGAFTLSQEGFDVTSNGIRRDNSIVVINASRSNATYNDAVKTVQPRAAICQYLIKY